MKNLSLIFIMLIFFTLFSCKKETQKLKPEAVASFLVKDNIFELHGEKSTDPDNDTLTYNWSTTSSKITIINGHHSIAKFNNPFLSTDETVKIVLTVSDGELQDTANVSVDIKGLSKLELWGLGINLQVETSNNKNYEWYYDQLNSGTYAGENCGPTAVTMAIKWFNESFALNPVDARNTYLQSGGWWYTSDIINYLNDKGVYNKTITLDNIGRLREQIDLGNIAILCLDMYYITYTNNTNYHINKFYMTSNTGWGHFIVIKGYKVVDSRTYYEVYDPYSMGQTYSDYSMKGKDRYYLDTDLDEATNIWWKYAIVVSKTAVKGLDQVDPAKIEHRSGR